MTELQKLKQLLDDLMIAYEAKCKNCILLIDNRATIWTDKDGLRVFGWGFSGQWPYSAEFIASALDRKFREEVVNNLYLLRMMQKESAEDEPERKTWTLCQKRMLQKRKRRRRNNSAR